VPDEAVNRGYWPNSGQDRAIGLSGRNVHGGPMKQTTLDGGQKKKGIEYKVYKAKRILNKYKHVDSWFWNKYSAHPYTGCEHACEYCYARADKYLHTDTPDDFSRIIKVKKNAAKLLRKELQKVKKNVIVTGNYQPAEKRFGLSRKMLEVVRDYTFPVHIIEKSDLVVKDLDIIKEIHEKAWACVSFSFSTVDEDVSQVFEPIAPSPQRRLKAMKEISNTGVITGANLMPVLPFITDGEEMMEEVVKEVKDHGGKFVLIGGLTLDDNVKERYFRLLRGKFPELIPQYEELYGSDPHEHYKRIAERGEQLCKKYGLLNRIPRYCLNFNQRVAEQLFDTTYRIELQNPKKAWVYRRAAWAIDELDKDIRDVTDLTSIPKVGRKMAVLTENIVNELRRR